MLERSLIGRCSQTIWLCLRVKLKIWRISAVSMIQIWASIWTSRLWRVPEASAWWVVIGQVRIHSKPTTSAWFTAIEHSLIIRVNRHNSRSLEAKAWQTKCYHSSSSPNEVEACTSAKDLPWAVAMISDPTRAWWAVVATRATTLAISSSNSNRCSTANQCSPEARWCNHGPEVSTLTTWPSHYSRTSMAHSSSRWCPTIWWTSSSATRAVTNNLTWWWVVVCSSSRTSSRITIWVAANGWITRTITTLVANRCLCSNSNSRATLKCSLNSKCNSRCSNSQIWCHLSSSKSRLSLSQVQEKRQDNRI